METISINIKTNVNDGIKEMRNYRKEINELRGQLINLDESSEEYAQTLQEVADRTFKLREMNENIRYTVTDLGEQFKTLTRIGRSVASGFEVVQGTMALFGVESDALEQTMVKLQAAISIVQGLEGLEDLGRQLGIAKIQFGGVFKSVKDFIGGLSGVQKALIGTGIGAFIVLLGVLIANWDKVSEAVSKYIGKTDSAKSANDELTASQKRLTDAINNTNNERERENRLLRAQGVSEVEISKKTLDELTANYEKQKKIRQEAYKQFKQLEYNKEHVFNSRVSDEDLANAKKNYDDALALETDYYNKVKDAQTDYEIAVINSNKKLTEDEKAKLKESARQRAEALAQEEQDRNEQLRLVTEIQEKLRLAQLSEEDRKIERLRIQYEKEKAILIANNQDTTALTQQFYNDVKAIKDSYEQKRAQDTIKANQELTEANKAYYDSQKAQIEEYYQYLTYLNERQMTTSTLPWGNYVDELSKIQSQMKLIQDQANEELANIDNEILNNPDLTLENYQFLCDEELRIRRETNDKLDALGNQQVKTQKAKNSAIAQFTIQAFSQAFSSAAGLISALQANIDTSTEDGFEQSKKYQKAQVWMNTASGILAAIASAWQLGPIVGSIVGGINSAFTLATGIAQIANIDKQKFNEPSKISGSGSAGGSANIAASILPTSITSNALAQETEIDLQSQRDMRVYVVESDISQTQNDIKTKVEESTF